MVKSIKLTTNTKRSAFIFSLLFTLISCETISNEMSGTLISGIGCAAVAKATGASDKEIAAAAVVCATVGYAVTKKMEDDRKKYASDEEFYTAQSNRLKQYQSNLNGEIKSMQASLDQNRAQIKKLTKSTSQSESERAELAKINESLNQQKVTLNNKLKEATDNLAYQRGLAIREKEAGTANQADANKQLAALESSVDNLKTLVASYESESASVGVFL